MQIMDIRAEQLKTIDQYGTVLMQFYETGSEVCEKITREIEKIPQEGLYFYALKFNIDQDKEFARTYDIESAPVLLMIKGNKILGRKESFMTSEEIHEWAHFSTIMGW